jgi:hypothetical protein
MNSELTGEIRYRSQFFTRKLILQVEYKFKETIMSGPYFETNVVKNWRDATFEDIQILYNKKGKS